jgi:hypothetical protein
MNVSAQIAKHFRELHFGGNWTWSSFQEHLSDVTWQQATTQVHGLNTIATLVYHCNYYVERIIKVLQGGPLDGSDKDAFAHPPIQSQEDWDNMLLKIRTDVETLTSLIEALPEEKLGEIFAIEKYGIYYRNLHGMIEHSYYHLGQIVLIKKLVLEASH